MSQRGFCEIGVFNGKAEVNLGTLMRSAYQLGAVGVFTIGKRYQRQSSDTTKAYRHIPVRHFLTFEEYLAALPMDTQIVGVEMGGSLLGNKSHPTRASYLLGAEDDGIPDDILARCHRRVTLASVRTPSFNVAVAGSIVLYDRFVRGTETPENCHDQ